MFHRSTIVVSIALLGSPVLAAWSKALGQRVREHITRAQDAPATMPIVFDGIVLEPDGTPAVGAIVVSSAGGQAVTLRDGSYRFGVQVPLDADVVRITAVGGDGSSLVASTSLGVMTTGSTRVEPLVLALETTCEPRWLPTFGGQPGVSTTQLPGTVRALAVFDDGGGAALYAAGDFLTAGGVLSYNIARWDGSNWSAPPQVGSVLAQFNPIYSLTVYDDGNGPALYVGARNRVVKWDGSSWSVPTYNMGGAYPDLPEVYALAVFDDGNGPALYAGGNFTTVEDLTVNHVARWDGSSWSAVGGGTNTDVFALTAFDDGAGPALYSGGSFTTAGGMAASRIAKWDGSSWSALGSGVNSYVRALAVFDDGSGPIGWRLHHRGRQRRGVLREVGWEQLVGPGSRDERERVRPH